MTNNLCNIERVKKGQVVGWYYNQKSLAPFIFYLQIQECIIGPFKSGKYREDLHEAGINNGYASFQVPLPCWIRSNEALSIKALDFNKSVIYEGVNFKYSPPDSFKYIEDTVITIARNTRKTKTNMIRAVVLAFYSPHKISINQINLINFFKSKDFYVVASVATDNTSLTIPNDFSPDQIIIRKNIGYDFGSWMHGYLANASLLKDYSNLYFVNDSITGPLRDDASSCFMDSEPHDICGITESYDKKYHIQSYYWRVSSKAIQGMALDGFFFHNAPVPQDKFEAINNYELEMASYFNALGYTSGAVMNSNALRTDTIKDFIRDASRARNHAKRIYTEDFYHILEQSPIMQSIINYYNQILGDNHLNPTHYYWKSLINHGFPFIKTELLTSNPTGYPFTRKITDEFNVKYIDLLEDIIRSKPISYSHYIRK
jgi:hypothetical protein